MFDIGFLELLVIGVLGLLVLGPERLPVAARNVGLWVGRIRRSMTNFQDDLDRHVRTEELKKKLLDPHATFNDNIQPPRGQQPAVDGTNPQPNTGSSNDPSIDNVSIAATSTSLVNTDTPTSVSPASTATNNDETTTKH